MNIQAPMQCGTTRQGARSMPVLILIRPIKSCSLERSFFLYHASHVSSAPNETVTSGKAMAPGSTSNPPIAAT